ncbi:MAG: cysteine--tRNA ligase [Candidatus Marsarchaeota archaeon]|nr:cysteine--tRNA ligase [Candidatus Marsarchaeota archaeon]MCL5413566.1 cysteine--tRNA ligase [Candidatus Marsarchaeota archaeon]
MLYVYNTLSRSKEIFRPFRGNDVNMFVCGQTVYDDAHLGHAKNYINFDVIARWLRFSGYNVKYIQNITDVDDKIINRANENGEEPAELARRYEARFMEDMDAIGVRKGVDKYPRSHDYIDAIRDQIQMLLDKGYAYIIEDDVYYDVLKFGDYTKLSGMRIEELAKHRIEPREGKRNPYDFSLWKGAKEGEPSWKIKLKADGTERVVDGRPGWHIEDTAITATLLGKQYDIHGGAIELIFPHHTNEIAQAEAAFDVKPFVKYWLHSGIMLIKGEKMSKSLKNFIRIRDLLKMYDAEALRLLVCSAHYRTDMIYTDNMMKIAQSRLRYLYASFSIFYNMKSSKSEIRCAEVDEIIGRLEKGFGEAMDDDFNSPMALSVLSSTIEGLRSYAESYPEISTQSKDVAVKEVINFAGVLGILEKDSYKNKLPDKASDMIKEREQLRKEKRFNEADSIRDRLKSEFGIIVEDSGFGSIWYGAG